MFSRTIRSWKAQTGLPDRSVSGKNQNTLIKRMHRGWGRCRFKEGNMIGDVVQEKKDIFDIRQDMAGPMESLRLGLEGFIHDWGFFPNVFYNENDINDSFRGIRMAIPDIDDYPGIFIHQDAPDTPIAGYKGIEFRSSITKSIREATGAKQLLWTVQDLTNIGVLPDPI